MATVTMIEENTADAEVREVYGDIKETRGINYIPNIWKTLAAHPPTLKRIWLGIKSVMAAGRLDPLTKEMSASKRPLVKRLLETDPDTHNYFIPRVGCPTL